MTELTEELLKNREKLIKIKGLLDENKHFLISRTFFYQKILKILES